MAINVFWDNSNIWLVGRNVCAIKEPGNESGFRIHFANLFSHVVADRDVEYAFVAGSLPPSNDDLWGRFEKLGAKVDTQQRGALTGGEVAVDQSMHLAMLERITDADEPGTIVLLTGDGNGYSEGKGFIRQLERAVKKNWQIEVVSWDAGCNRHLKDFALTHGSYISLEPAYLNITFINNLRYAVKV
ncbi:NYN domain-containing protein [Pseudomonas viridiflava]|uniref:NYN domain-containing protein n=1 Tax=Pseudomonas viridiflava TaxID=33069 RepID=UPI000F02ABA8|nr:NYN domain-containing protein [Pseudomonas viridiflava]